MFWEKFVKRVYRKLGAYIRERQREGAMVEIEPLVVVRAFVGMIIHHSLNNNLWDRKRQLLKLSNQAAAHFFTGILLQGVSSKSKSISQEGGPKRPAVKKSTVKRSPGKRLHK